MDSAESKISVNERTYELLNETVIELENAINKYDGNYSEEMKFIQLLFVCLFFIACDSFSDGWDNCPWEKNKEFIRIEPLVDIDTVISSVHFEYYSKYANFQTEYKDLGSDSISVSIIGKGDTLNYALEIKYYYTS